MCLRAEEAFDPGELPQLLSDLFDLLRALAAFFAQLRELRAPRLVVGEELLRERTAADLLENRAQRRLDAVVDDACPTREVAVLGDVRDRVAHVLVASLIQEVDDQLQ